MRLRTRLYLERKAKNDICIGWYFLQRFIISLTMESEI
jgi:hypothetical protein